MKGLLFNIALNILALANIILKGRPCLLEDHLNARRKEVAVRSSVIFKWVAHVLLQVNKHMYALQDSLGDCTYSGPAKSTPVMVKDAWVLT